MSPEQGTRFETEFAPHIVEKIASLYRHGDVNVSVIPRGASNAPARIRVIGVKTGLGFPNPLNVYLAWSDAAVEALLAEPGRSHFDRYVAALPIKLERWQIELPVDFSTRTQRDHELVISDLDFDA